MNPHLMTMFYRYPIFDWIHPMNMMIYHPISDQMTWGYTMTWGGGGLLSPQESNPRTARGI